MVRRDPLLRTSALGLTAAVLIGAAGLAACNRSDNASTAQASAADTLPLTTAGAEPVTRAPTADLLPAAAPARIVRVADPRDAYAYLDDAYYEGDAYEDAPPDYAFDYDGVSPWAWQGDDGLEFVEPVSGGYRYYYYRQGAAWPYLIRDNGYAYGFDGPRLAVVYDRGGRLLPSADIDRRAVEAGRYLARAQGLLDASRRASRRSVAAANWAAARSEISAQRSALAAARSRQDAWRAYDAAHAATQAARWEQERNRRQAYAQRFEDWRQTGFQGGPPAPASRHDVGLRQAQAEPAFRQDAPRSAAPAPQAVPPLSAPIQRDEGRRFADRRGLQQDQARQQAEQQRQAAEDQLRGREQAQQQARQQAQSQARDRALAEQQQQAQADQRHAQDQARQQQALAERQQRAQADQQRQAQEQARQQAQQQQRAQIEQQHQAQDQARQQAFAQRQQEQQQRRQAQEQERQQQHQQAEQQRQAQEQARQQQAQQQAQQHQQAEQQRQAQEQAHQQQARQQQAQQQHQPPHPGQPPAAHPAGRDEHREHQ